MALGLLHVDLSDPNPNRSPQSLQRKTRACEGTLACSTCHMIFDQELFDSLPPLDEEEEDMLDLAIAVTDTSRLGCQIKVTPAMDGAEIRLPDEVSAMN